ncbi:hypothetical protein EI94DRAFT_1700523 [Lactarius quietus]|nr:hypothetical protein EI94DRAFT_1700523 [Lactarius quietus]
MAIPCLGIVLVHCWVVETLHRQRRFSSHVKSILHQAVQKVSSGRKCHSLHSQSYANVGSLVLGDSICLGLIGTLECWSGETLPVRAPVWETVSWSDHQFGGASLSWGAGQFCADKQLGMQACDQPERAGMINKTSSPLLLSVNFLPQQVQEKDQKRPLRQLACQGIASCDSAKAVLGIIQHQAEGFDKVRDGDEVLMKWISSLVHVVYNISLTLVEGVGMWLKAVGKKLGGLRYHPARSGCINQGPGPIQFRDPSAFQHARPNHDTAIGHTASTSPPPQDDNNNMVACCDMQQLRSHNIAGATLQQYQNNLKIMRRPQQGSGDDKDNDLSCSATGNDDNDDFSCSAFEDRGEQDLSACGGRGGRHFPAVIAQMSKWNWDSVVVECAGFLGPAGYQYVQVDPVQEHLQGPNSGWITSLSCTSSHPSKDHSLITTAPTTSFTPTVTTTDGNNHDLTNSGTSAATAKAGPWNPVPASLSSSAEPLMSLVGDDSFGDNTVFTADFMDDDVEAQVGVYDKMDLNNTSTEKTVTLSVADDHGQMDDGRSTNRLMFVGEPTHRLRPPLQKTVFQSSDPTLTSIQPTLLTDRYFC